MGERIREWRRKQKRTAFWVRSAESPNAGAHIKGASADSKALAEQIVTAMRCREVWEWSDAPSERCVLGVGHEGAHRTTHGTDFVAASYG